MATAGWDWARAKAQHTNSAETRFFIMAIGLYGVDEAINGYTTGDTHYSHAFYAVYWNLSTKKPFRYRDAGVNIDEADRAVASIKKLARQTFTPGVLTDIGSFGAMYQLAGYRKPVLVELGRRRGHQAEDRVPDRPARHRRRRPGEPLRERHRGAGRDAAVLSGLLRGGQAGRGCGGGSGGRDCARLPEERLRADRRRDGGDAGLLRGRRVRPGGLHRGRGRARRAAHGRRVFARATCCSGCPRTGCTPTAIRWRASCCSKWPGTVRKRCCRQWGRRWATSC